MKNIFTVKRISEAIQEITRLVEPLYESEIDDSIVEKKISAAIFNCFDDIDGYKTRDNLLEELLLKDGVDPELATRMIRDGSIEEAYNKFNEVVRNYEKRDVDGLYNILILESLEDPRCTKRKLDTNSLQELVGADDITYIFPHDLSACYIVSFDQTKPFNRALVDEFGVRKGSLYGNIVITGLSRDGLCSLNCEQLQSMQDKYFDFYTFEMPSVYRSITSEELRKKGKERTEKVKKERNTKSFFKLPDIGDPMFDSEESYEMDLSEKTERTRNR